MGMVIGSNKISRGFIFKLIFLPDQPSNKSMVRGYSKFLSSEKDIRYFQFWRICLSIEKLTYYGDSTATDSSSI